MLLESCSRERRKNRR